MYADVSEQPDASFVSVRWNQKVSRKRRYISSKLHGVTSRKTAKLVVIFIRTPRGTKTLCQIYRTETDSLTYSLHGAESFFEKLTGLQLVKKFPAFHGTRMFITALTSVRQLSLSWARPIQSIYPHPSSWRSILILSTHLRLGLPSNSIKPGWNLSKPAAVK